MATFLDNFRPDHYAERVCEIDSAALAAQGIRLMILDLDNTLLPWKGTVIGDDVREWVGNAKSAGIKVAIVSNTHHPRRLSLIAAELDVPCIAHALKPRGKGFRKAARLAGCDPGHCVVVGDQLLTDILGGNLAGMKTILVKPIHRREFIGTKVSRMIERLIFSLLPEKPWLGTKSEGTQSQTGDTK
jgi:hypothetical protein